MSIRGATEAPQQHPGPPTLYTAWGAPDSKQRCWHSLVPCLHHVHAAPATSLQPCQGAEAAPGEGKQETGRKANTPQRAAASQWLLQGQSAVLSLGLDLITPAPAPVSCRLSASHCLRCAGQDHCHTLSRSLREYIVLQGTLRMASIINNH